MNDRYKLYDKDGRRIGTAVAQNGIGELATGLSGCLLIGIVFLPILLPFWAFYKGGRDGFNNVSMWLKVPTLLFVICTFVFLVPPSLIPNNERAPGLLFAEAIVLVSAFGSYQYGKSKKHEMPPNGASGNYAVLRNSDSTDTASIGNSTQSKPKQYQWTGNAVVELDDDRPLE